MTLAISLSSLSSRLTRTSATGATGIRRIAINATKGIGGDQKPESIWDGLARIAGSIVSGIVAAFKIVASINWTKIWSAIVSASLFILNFNWNVSDDDLDKQIKGAEAAIAGAKGALAGASLGFAICGIIPTATIAVFNEAMALHILKELGEDAAEEIASAVANLIKLQLRQMLRKGFTALYKNFRHLLRPAALGVAQLLVNAGILDQDSVDKANKNRNEPWSFASALENTIENIKDPNEQQYAEEFWEELGEACIEAGYIVAGGIDSYLAQQRLASASILGSTTVVSIAPVRSAAPTSST